jgi:DNA-3-methyladenine glycosylase II
MVTKILVLDDKSVKAGCKFLTKADPVLGVVMKQVGPFVMSMEPDPFTMLARSILGQQISVTAARAIRMRLLEALSPRGFTVAGIAALSPQEMRAAGLSRQKTAYLHDLTEHVISGRLDLEALASRSDEEVIRLLMAVKGIGAWTAHMFLIFCLGRRDIFPGDDYGVRSAIRKVYELDELPTKKDVEERANIWRPYATIASWYLWRSLELGQPQEKHKVGG